MPRPKLSPWLPVFPRPSPSVTVVSRSYGNRGGGTRFFVACSNAYASSISLGSLQAMPVKLTPNGPGFALKLAGNGGVGVVATSADGAVTGGDPGLGAMCGPLRPRNRKS